MKLHNAITRGNWADALKRALGVTKSEGGLERYGETLTPTIDLWSLPEWAQLRDEQLWAFNQTVGPVAAEQAGVAVVNPAGSNRIVVVTAGASGVSTAGGQVAVSLTTEAVVTASYALFAGGGLSMPIRDVRNSQVATALRMALPQFWTGTTAGALITFNLRTDLTRHPVNDLQKWTSLPVVLTPGFALIAESVTNNDTVTVTMAGTVRHALLGELE